MVHVINELRTAKVITKLETQRETDRDKQIERERDTETDRQTDRHRMNEKDRERGGKLLNQYCL